MHLYFCLSSDYNVCMDKSVYLLKVPNPTEQLQRAECPDYAT